MDHIWLKLIHIVGAILILGTGLGSAFYLFRANMSRDIHSIYFATRNAVLADWLFTLPAVIILPLTGFLMMVDLALPFTALWIWGSVLLYLVAGIAWLIAVYIQIRMRDLAQEAITTGRELSPNYWKLAQIWLWLGAIAFPAVAMILYLMIFKTGG